MHPSSESITRAAYCVAAALENDPFYHAISVDFDHDAEQRRAVLTAYFEYSFREGQQLGFANIADDNTGAAIWAKPQPAAISQPAEAAKHRYLATLLGETGLRNYHTIIQFMTPHAAAHADMWYLSILGICPDLQGRGIGEMLLRPVLEEADKNGVTCYVETFNARTLKFYNRLGYATGEAYSDPVTGEQYWILVRPPHGV